MVISLLFTMAATHLHPHTSLICTWISHALKHTTVLLEPVVLSSFFMIPSTVTVFPVPTPEVFLLYSVMVPCLCLRYNANHIVFVFCVSLQGSEPLEYFGLSGWRWRSVIECLPSVCEALGLIPRWRGGGKESRRHGPPHTAS